MIITELQEFISVLPQNGELIGIDFGTKKSGLAISTLNRKMVIPFCVTESTTQNIIAIIKKNNPCALVIGIPINLDGTSNTQVELVKKFTKNIHSSLNLPIFLEDERMTSRAAEGILMGYNIKRIDRDKISDSIAACLILEGVLKKLILGNLP